MTGCVTLLLVDDDPITRKILASMIGKKYPQITIFFAENGLEALDMVDLHHPDLMILDLGMIHMGGFEVLHQLTLRNQIMQILVMSAYDMEDVTELLYSISHQPDLEFIKKPVEKDVFFQLIDRLLTRIDSAVCVDK